MAPGDDILFPFCLHHISTVEVFGLNGGALLLAVTQEKLKESP